MRSGAAAAAAGRARGRAEPGVEPLLAGEGRGREPRLHLSHPHPTQGWMGKLRLQPAGRLKVSQPLETLEMRSGLVLQGKLRPRTNPRSQSPVGGPLPWRTMQTMPWSALGFLCGLEDTAGGAAADARPAGANPFLGSRWQIP